MIFLWSVPGLFQMENGKQSDFVFVFLIQAGGQLP